MATTISCITIRTKLKSKQAEAILYTLRNVQHVSTTETGYVVVLEAPIKEDNIGVFLDAIKSFDFVEDVADVATVAVQPWRETDFRDDLTSAVTSAFRAKEPKPDEYGDDDLDTFATDMRAWRKMATALNGALEEFSA